MNFFARRGGISARFQIGEISWRCIDGASLAALTILDMFTNSNSGQSAPAQMSSLGEPRYNCITMLEAAPSLKPINATKEE